MLRNVQINISLMEYSIIYMMKVGLISNCNKYWNNVSRETLFIQL